MMEGCLEMLGWCDFDFGTCYCYDSFYVILCDIVFESWGKVKFLRAKSERSGH